jgi:hypothetical protein
MNKLLLAVTIFGIGAGVFIPARRSTIQRQCEANAAREAWLSQTQLLAAAQSDRASLVERVRGLKQSLARSKPGGEYEVWAALQTNPTTQLTPELRERLLEELGYNWRSSDEFIVVSKKTLRQIQMFGLVNGGKLSNVAAAVLAITPGERAQVQAAIQRVQTDFKEWALAHTERSEPNDDVLADYTLPNDPAMSISKAFATAVFEGLGKERADLFLPGARSWMVDEIGLLDNTARMIIRRGPAGNEQRLKIQVPLPTGTSSSHDLLDEHYGKFRGFPRAFLPLFPKGWADVAKRDGFELPKEPQEK